MFNLFKVKKALVFSFILVFVFSLPVSANKSDWKNPAYSFEQVKTIFVKNPVFAYNYIDKENDATNPYKDINATLNHKEHGSNKKHFEKYPNSQNVIMSILAKQIDKLPQYNFVHESAGTGTAGSELVLTIKITDFGWYCKHNKNKWSGGETTVDPFDISNRDISRRGNVDVNEGFSLEYTRYFSKYDVREFASAEFILSDAKTGEQVWKYTDYRSHESNENALKKDWPETTMNHIFSTAFEKMPFGQR